jgi:hypothetical protein
MNQEVHAAQLMIESAACATIDAWRLFRLTKAGPASRKLDTAIEGLDLAIAHKESISQRPL